MGTGERKSSRHRDGAAEYARWKSGIDLLAERFGPQCAYDPQEIYRLVRSAVDDKDASIVELARRQPPIGMSGEEIDRQIEESIARAIKPKAGKYASEIEPQIIEWLWPQRIARGKLSVIDGDPGTGKSTLTIDIAARVSKGANFPDGSLCPRGKAVLLSAEDGPGDTIVPRLESAEAELDGVVVVHPSLGTAGQGLISLPRDLQKVEDTVLRIRACLVVIDPLSAFLSAEIDGYKDQDVRKLTSALASMAERTKSAVVLVRHLSKGERANAMYRGLGSIGTIAAARSAFLVAPDPRDDSANQRRLFVGVKSNLASLPDALAFNLVEDARFRTSRIEWSNDPVQISAEEALFSRVRREDVGLSSAVAFLTSQLTSGPKPTAEIERLGEEHGIAKRTVERARECMRIVTHKAKGELNSSWFMHLPGASCARCEAGNFGR